MIHQLDESEIMSEEKIESTKSIGIQCLEMINDIQEDDLTEAKLK